AVPFLARAGAESDLGAHGNPDLVRDELPVECLDDGHVLAWLDLADSGRFAEGGGDAGGRREAGPLAGDENRLVGRLGLEPIGGDEDERDDDDRRNAHYQGGE